jgi:hypothetical protein
MRNRFVNTTRRLQRDTATTVDFMQDVTARLANRVQLTTDGHRA